MDKDVGAKFNTISQIGLIVKDLKKTEEEIEKVLGVKPVGYGVTPDTNKKYHGKEVDFRAKLAFYRFANIEIELIQPIYGESMWQDFLDNGNEGLHHIRFSIDNLQDVVDKMKEKNFDVTMEGESVKGKGLKWAYFDTQDSLKFIIEVFNEFEPSAQKGE